MPRRYIRRLTRRVTRRVRRIVRRRPLRVGRSLRMVPPQFKVHNFKRTVDITPLLSLNGTLSTVTNLLRATQGAVTLATPNYYGGASMAFRLSDISDVADFTNLFDQYRINGIAVKIIPCVTNIRGSTSGGTLPDLGCFLHIVNDVDDAATPAASAVGMDALRQYESYRSINPYRNNGAPIKFYIKPRVAPAIYGSGTFTGYGSVRPPWIDLVSTGVDHYGMKFLVETIEGALNQLAEFKVEATYYFSCRGVR